ncbi:MAG: hypothetical protein KGY57_02775 [Gammaproteobacteria bacterium]|nr:hypothetical protein [Gammaproteobacteria bacterium]
MIATKTKFLSALSLALLTGCAASPKNITPSYVSPMQYQSFNCNQVESEMRRVSSRVRSVADIQDKEASNDAAAVGVGLVLFWPALFFLAGSDKEQELAQLMGEHEALQQSAIQKECGFADQLEG